MEKDEDGRNLISRGWGNLYFTEAEAAARGEILGFAEESIHQGIFFNQEELQRLKLLGEETVAARESRDPIAVLSEEEVGG